MKLAILAAFLGSAAVASASASKTVAGDVDVDFESHSIVKYVYAPPAVDTDLATLWNELAKEAAFMQQEIALGRTLDECYDDCETAKDNDSDFNRGRCRKNCEQMDDQGNTNRGGDCGCRESFPTGGNRYDRCMTACIDGKEDRRDRCMLANSCSECRRECGTGVKLDDCLWDLDCPGQDRSDRRDCNSARTCGECNSFCDNRSDRLDCRDWNDCSSKEQAKDKLMGAHQQ